MVFAYAAAFAVWDVVWVADRVEAWSVVMSVAGDASDAMVYSDEYSSDDRAAEWTARLKLA